MKSGCAHCGRSAPVAEHDGQIGRADDAITIEIRIAGVRLGAVAPASQQHGEIGGADKSIAIQIAGDGGLSEQFEADAGCGQSVDLIATHVHLLGPGGLALKALNPRTMEVNAHPGLFVIGELLDLDGPIGGFSFLAAFATAELAGRAAAANLG